MRCARLTLISFLCLPLVACFDEPVREHLHLVFTSGGQIVVTALQLVADRERAEENSELEGRLDDVRADLEHGLDPWSRRFELLDPLAEHKSLERVDGEIRRSTQSVVLASFDDVALMLEADGLSGSLEVRSETFQLQLFPTGGSRATSRQRDEVDRGLREWSEQVALYFEAMIDLYEHFEQAPTRAVPCLAHILDKSEELGSSDRLDPREEGLVVRVKEAMETLSEALVVSQSSAYSFNELTRLVYDPFPARLTISVDGTVLSSEGFIQGENHLERPPVDAWHALMSLEGRWVAPDLVTAAVAPVPEELQPDLDPALFAALPRRYLSPPSAAEVQTALLMELVPEELLVLRWHRADPSSEEDGEDNIDWLRVMAEAEASVPEAN
jgi:hypothetical protein